MSLPITKDQVNTQLANAFKTYYSMLAEGASQSDLSNQRNIIEELTALQKSFEGNLEYDNLVSSCTSYFKTACSSLSTDDISTAFQYYKNLTSYIKDNSIGFNTSTNEPIFETNITKTYNSDGTQLNVLSQ